MNLKKLFTIDGVLDADFGTRGSSAVSSVRSAVSTIFKYIYSPPSFTFNRTVIDHENGAIQFQEDRYRPDCKGK